MPYGIEISRISEDHFVKTFRRPTIWKLSEMSGPKYSYCELASQWSLRGFVLQSLRADPGRSNIAGRRLRPGVCGAQQEKRPGPEDAVRADQERLEKLAGTLKK